MQTIDIHFKDGGTKKYTLFSVFALNENESFENIFPVDAHGNVQKDFVCPTNKELCAKRLQEIKIIIDQDPEGLILERIKYPTKWELPEPEIIDTCYCERCLKLFEEYIGEPIDGVGGEGNETENKALYIDGSYYHEWLEFKTGYINSFVKDVKDMINQSGKGIKLGILAVPWDNSEYGDAIKRILGQDFNVLANYVDFISPMLYHKMCAKDVTWIKNRLDYFWNFGKRIIPFYTFDSLDLAQTATQDLISDINIAGYYISK